MKTSLACTLALISSLAFAQKNISINRSIHDDGKTLSIRVDGTIDGQSINYNRTFNVGHLSKTERNDLRDHLLDSLGVGLPEPPIAPHPPVAPRAPMSARASIAPHAPAAPHAPMAPHAPVPPEPPVAPRFDGESHSRAYYYDNSRPSVRVYNGRNEVVAMGGKQPYTKEVRFNPESGQLYLRYRFSKDGDEYQYERKIDARDKTEQERQRLIDRFEQEIGLPK